MPRSQPITALGTANNVRLARAVLRGRVLRGEVTVGQLLTDPPPEVIGMELLAVLAFTRSECRGSTGRRHWRITLGRRAAYDNINLLQPVALASKDTIAWAIINAPKVTGRQSNYRQRVPA